jgi:uncharacterized membrane protein YeaQ/YmgE (transglycosylase-associated protein family)
MFAMTPGGLGAAARGGTVGPTRIREPRMLLLGIIVLGMFIGWLAQLVLGMGTRPNAQSLIAGLVGSFVGGLLVSLIAGDGLELRPSGLIGSFLGAVIVLLIWRAATTRRTA